MRICPHVPNLKKIEGGANFFKICLGAVHLRG